MGNFYRNRDVDFEIKYNCNNHVASFTNLDDVKILTFQTPGSSRYKIRFLFDEPSYTLTISGDLGYLVAQNECNMTFEKFSQFLNSPGYFLEKVKAMSRPAYMYDGQKARKKLEEYLDSLGTKFEEFLKYDEDYCLEEPDEAKSLFTEAVLDNFTDAAGISDNGAEVLARLDDALRTNFLLEEGYELGRMPTGTIELYLKLFALAVRQLYTENAYTFAN